MPASVRVRELHPRRDCQQQLDLAATLAAEGHTYAKLGGEVDSVTCIPATLSTMR
jgi:hypothetical protein